MQKPEASPLRPETILWLFYCSAIVCCFAGVLILGYATFSQQDMRLASLPDSRVAVGSSDMLGIEITLSGISIPLAISYLLSRSKELQVSICEQATYFLSRNEIGVEEFNQAQAVYEDATNAFYASDIYLALKEVLRFDSPEADDKMSDACLKWVISHEFLQTSYKVFFAESDDRLFVLKCIKIVAIPALLLIADLFMRFAGLRGVWLDISEIIILVSAACANLLMYFVLIYIVKLKSDLRGQTRKELSKICKTGSREVKAALLHIKSFSEIVSSDMSEMAQKLGATTKNDVNA